MDINQRNLILFIIGFILFLGIYYFKILSVDKGESKNIKMMKHVLLLLVISGLFSLFSLTEDKEIKAFWIVVIAILFNVFTVVHSTRKCNYPKLYVIQLSLYTAVITGVIARILWYTYFNNLFELIIDEEIKIDPELKTKFESTELTMGILNESDTEECPDTDEGDYDSQMNELKENDLETYNNCLETYIRDDLDNQ